PRRPAATARTRLAPWFSRLSRLRGPGAVPSSRLVELGDQPAVRQECLQPILRAQPPDGGDQIVLKLPGEFRFHGRSLQARILRYSASSPCNNGRDRGA